MLSFHGDELVDLPGGTYHPSCEISLWDFFTKKLVGRIPDAIHVDEQWKKPWLVGLYRGLYYPDT